LADFENKTFLSSSLANFKTKLMKPFVKQEEKRPFRIARKMIAWLIQTNCLIIWFLVWFCSALNLNKTETLWMLIRCEELSFSRWLRTFVDERLWMMSFVPITHTHTHTHTDMLLLLRWISLSLTVSLIITYIIILNNKVHSVVQWYAEQEDTWNTQFTQADTHTHNLKWGLYRRVEEILNTRKTILWMES